MLVRKFTTPFIAFLLSISMLSLVVILWQKLYLIYHDSADFNGDIFRHFFYSNLAPAYGIDKFDTFNYQWLTGIVAAYAVFLMIERWLNSFAYLVLVILGFILLLGTTEPLRITHNLAHFGTFLEDINAFNSISDLLHSYVSKQNLLSVHGAHYPPGILMLLMIFGTSYGYKVFLLLIFTLALYLFYVYIEKKKEALAALLFLPAFLIFPTLDFVALPFLFFMLLLILEKQSTHFAYTLLGIVFFIWSFFSFISFVGGVYILIYQLMNVKSFFSKRNFKLYLSACIGFGSSYILFNYVLGIDLFDCFSQSIQNNVSLNSSPFDSIARYLIRSSGNFLSFVLGAGILFGSLFLKASTETINRHRITMLFTLLLLSFSGLFYMETDRVWYCFLPIIAWVASDMITTFSTTQKIILLSLSAIYLAVVELGFQLYT
jgi:hypothetical protein